MEMDEKTAWIHVEENPGPIDEIVDHTCTAHFCLDPMQGLFLLIIYHS